MKDLQKTSEVLTRELPDTVHGCRFPRTLSEAFQNHGNMKLSIPDQEISEQERVAAWVAAVLVLVLIVALSS